jgi:phage tail-like protein
VTDFIVTPDTIDLNLSPVSPLDVILVDTLLKAVSTEQMDACEFLIQVHPEIYKESRLIQEMTPNDFTRYRLFLRSIDASLCEIRDLLGRMYTFLDPYEAPYPILPLLAPIVGIEFNYDIPEEQARREIANAIFLWQRKGTRDNIRDWISFLTGFRVRIREFYKEVLRTNVWGQAYAESPSTITNRGGRNYGTLPHLDEHHRTNAWAGNNILRPFFNFTQAPDTNYGVHGFTQIRQVDGGEILPGYLFRNHVALYLDVPDENLERTWYGEPYYFILIQKIQRILDLICFYGVVKHLFWRIVTDEDVGWCEQVTFQAIPVWSEGWDDLEDLPEATEETATVSCNEVEEESISCIAETGCIDVEDFFCGEGRLANVLICTNDPERVTNSHGDSLTPLWATWFNLRYWVQWAGRYPTTLPTLGTPGESADGDILQTWIPTTAGTLTTEVVLPAEFTVGERFIGPHIGTGTGQGREFKCGMSDWVLDICADGRFDDVIIFEEWNNVFQDNIEHNEDWEFSGTFVDNIEHEDDWEVADTFQDNIEHFEDWEVADTFQDNIEHFDDWEAAEVFQDNIEHFDDWEENTPFAIPDLELWLDGSDGPLASSPVGTWLDKSENELDAVQSDVTARPDLDEVDAEFNANGSVAFDGVNDFMEVPTDAVLTTQDFTAFVVGKWTTVSADTTFISKIGSQAKTTGWGVGASPVQDSEGDVARFWINTQTANFVDVSVPLDTPTILCCSYDQTTMEFAVNSVPFNTLYGGGVSVTGTPLYIGAQYHTSFTNNANGFLDGEIAEVLYYSRALTPSEKQTILNYLSGRYGITLQTLTILEHEENWEATSPGILTLQHSEEWLAEVEEASEEWEPPTVETSLLLVEESWEPPSVTPSLVVFEPWEDDTEEGLLVFEPWEDAPIETLLVSEPWES